MMSTPAARWPGMPAASSSLWSCVIEDAEIAKDSGDGSKPGIVRPLVDQLEPHRILKSEGDQSLHALPERLVRVATLRADIHALIELSHAVRVHRVVERVLGREVGVQRRSAHPHLPG